MRFSVRVRAQDVLFRRVCFSLPAQTWSHLTQRRILRRPPHGKAHSAPATPPRRDQKAHSGGVTLTERRSLRVGPHQRAHSACEWWLRREAVFADLRTLLRTHGRSRGRAGPWAPRRRRPHGPRDARALGPEVHATGAVTQPSAHTSSRSLILFAHLPVLVPLDVTGCAITLPLDASEWQADRKRALRGFVWVDTSAKMPT